MNKQRGLFVISALALTAISAFAFFDWKKVTVESNDGKRVYKRIDHDGAVRLSKRLSDAPCVQGRSWGYDRNGIWVDDGCRAVFEYEDRGSGNSGGGWTKPSIGFETKRIKVESNGNRAYKKIDTSGGVRLSKRLSDKPCVQGRSWGYDRNGVWVDNGCRAEFEVRSRTDGGRDPWFGNGGTGVPNWAVGQWKGFGRGADGANLQIRSDGTLYLRSRGEGGDGRRGRVRGDRVEIGDLIYRLDRSGREGIVFTPVKAATGELRFNKA